MESPAEDPPETCLADGRRVSGEELLPIVYEDLRRLANRYFQREDPGITIQPTALVHEAYMRLVGDREMEWQNRRHFYAAAGEAMRRILIDHARRRGAIRRGGADGGRR